MGIKRSNREKKRQGWEFALLLFTLSLKIALLKERPWAIRSRHSFKKSDRKQIALVALYKRVTRANHSLIKSGVSDSLVFWERIALPLFHSQKRTIRSQKNSLFLPCFWQFLTAFSHFKPKIESLPSPFLKEQLERFALGKERIVISLFLLT